MTLSMGPPHEEMPSTFEELLHRAEDAAGGRSRSYVTDAVIFAKWICGDGKRLFEENVELRRQLAEK